jgi:hypothetical protein
MRQMVVPQRSPIRENALILALLGGMGGRCVGFGNRVSERSETARTVVIERGGNQYGVTCKDGVIVDRWAVSSPDYRQHPPPDCASALTPA